MYPKTEIGLLKNMKKNSQAKTCLQECICGKNIRFVNDSSNLNSKGNLERQHTRLHPDSAYVQRKSVSCEEIIVKMLRARDTHNGGRRFVRYRKTGNDWVGEAKVAVDTLLDLEYGKIKLVAAYPESYRYANLDAMIADYAKKKRTLRISSEYLTTAAFYIKSLKSYKKKYGSKDPLLITPWVRKGTNNSVQIHLSFATEAKPPEDVDAIIDVTETGTTLRQNKLRIADTILESSAQLIANKTSMKNAAKREKMLSLTLMRGAVYGRKYLHIFANVSEKNLPKLMVQIPSLKKPTIFSVTVFSKAGLHIADLL